MTSIESIRAAGWEAATQSTSYTCNLNTDAPAMTHAVTTATPSVPVMAYRVMQLFKASLSVGIKR